MDQDADATSVMCFKCGEQPPGEGGVLCSGCLSKLRENAASYWNEHKPQGATVVAVKR